MPLIGVIIPVYNVEKYLRQCIESVLCQEFKDIEVILVDDGSTDSSRTICDEYRLKDNRINVIHKANGGLSDARNEGIKYAKSKYLMFLDSDDYWNSDKALNNISIKLKENKDIDIIMYKEISYYMKSNKFYHNKYYYDNNFIVNKDKKDVIEYLIKTNNFSATAWSVVVKRELIVKNNIYFTKGIKSEDIDWSINLFIKAKTFDSINDRFLIYRKERPDSITNSVGDQNIRDLLFIINKWSKLLCDNKDYEVNKIFLGYLAYQYSILIYLLSKVNICYGNEILEEVKKYKYLLRYSLNNKSIYAKYLVSILGLNNSIKILGIIIDLKEKIRKKVKEI